MSRIRVHPSARAEFNDIRAGYESQQRGLGGQFYEALERAFELIREFPEAWPIQTVEIRRAQVPRFPYVIFYKMIDETILVIACIHAKRDPQNWPGQ